MRVREGPSVLTAFFSFLTLLFCFFYWCYNQCFKYQREGAIRTGKVRLDLGILVQRGSSLMITWPTEANEYLQNVKVTKIRNGFIFTNVKVISLRMTKERQCRF